MVKSSARPLIRLRGVRHNNLKDFDLDLPLNELIVITGLSGSGKSSLAFDTLFAEGQRRYIETFSPYARQFFDRMDKPRVDSIEGIPPAIAIEQRNAVKTTRSTVGTMTELCDYMKMLWPRIAQLHCRQCSRPVQKESPEHVWSVLTRLSTWPTAEPPGGRRAEPAGGGNGLEVLVTFDLPLTEKLPLEECLALVSKQGYQRLLIGEKMVRIEEAGLKSGLSGLGMEPKPPEVDQPEDKVADKAPESALSGQALDKAPGASTLRNHLIVVQDRVRLTEENRARFSEACEQAYHFGKGKLVVWDISASSVVSNPRFFSNRLHCAQCDIEYSAPTPALFSFNHPIGACPACRGFGRIISIDYNLALPDRSKTLAQCVVRPWQSGQGAECQDDLLRKCRQFGIPTDVPFEQLPKKWRDFVLEGEPGYGKDAAHEWPRAWYGVKGYFRWLESKSYKMHVRVLLSRYRAYTPCPDCHGTRFQPEALLYKCAVAATSDEKGPIVVSDRDGSAPAQARAEAGATLKSGRLERPGQRVAQRELTLADFYQLPIRDALHFIEGRCPHRPSRPNDTLALILNEVRSRLRYLDEVGLGYLSLDRPTRSLSGGETERVNLTTCLGSRLVNTLFVLDEPSVGLHPRDTQRLIGILERLRDAGNTVVVVEHEASVIRAANQIVDLGPGHGATGGRVVFQGTYPQILRSSQSLTGQYLSGHKQIPIPKSQPQRLTAGVLTLAHANKHNLKDLTVDIPLGRLVCVTGVSGSGKTTLVREVLWPALTARLESSARNAKASDRLGSEPNADEDGQEAGAGYVPARVRGAEQLGRVLLVDQSILAKTPRSNPAVYIGAFDEIRELFAQSELARQRGLKPSAFSFNSTQGQCQRCRGAGFEKIEMQFLSDVFIRCPECNGRRYRSHILEIQIQPGAKEKADGAESGGALGARRGPPLSPSGHQNEIRCGGKSIADLLEATVEEAGAFLDQFGDSRVAQRARDRLRLLEEVGLGYLQLGQPINTLSGGESQRLKLVRHLADAEVGMGKTEDRKHKAEIKRQKCGASERDRGFEAPKPGLFAADPNARKPFLFLFDEPTVGLHFDDVRVLLGVFQRLVNAGHSVVVIEHNLDVIKSADWIVDLGPEAGDQGGEMVAQGTPEEIANCPSSHTGRALRSVLKAKPQIANRKSKINRA